MATSGTTTFDLDVASIINEAYNRCGLDANTGYDAKQARICLNLLLIDWTNRGINVWKVNQATIDMVDGTASYTLNVAVVDIIDAVLRRSSVDTAMTRISLEEYLRYPSKTTEGRPTVYAIEKNRETASGHVMYVWPTPENSTDDIIVWEARHIEDVSMTGTTVGTQTVDVPRRFLPALISGLSYKIAERNSSKVDPNIRVELKRIYDEDLTWAIEKDRDNASSYFIPYVRRV